MRLALTSRVAVLTGGPGCGKRFTVRSVVALTRAKGAKVVLGAPTGRAAKRLAELTGHEAATIHRLLQLRPGGEPSFDATTPLDAGFDELDELAHAYAVTIHRSQGSEYPAVVIPLTMGSWMMLQRTLLYTGVTRAKKLVVLAGSRRALAVAVRSKGSGRRHTALTHRLRGGRGAQSPS